MRVLIVGCGYVGVPLGAELVRQGHEVYGLRRTRAADDSIAAAGMKPLIGDITQPADLAKLPGPFDWVVNTVSSAHGGAQEYRAVYLQGTRNLLAWLLAAPPQRLVYTSSTSVYGQDDGSLVDESSPTEPESATSRVLLDTEGELLQAVRQKNFPAVILRVAGIYGPERGYLLKQYLKDELPLADQGSRIANMIHREDVAGCILATLERGRPGELYNAVDDEPVAHLDFFRWLSGTLGRPLPSFSTGNEGPARKRGLTNKKVTNRKLKEELGYRFKYPTFREGYATEIGRLRNAGLIKS